MTRKNEIRQLKNKKFNFFLCYYQTMKVTRLRSYFPKHLPEKSIILKCNFLLDNPEDSRLFLWRGLVIYRQKDLKTFYSKTTLMVLNPS